MIAKLKSYFNPTSLTWWGGAGLIGVGIAQAMELSSRAVDTMGEVLATLLGGGSMPPAGYILLGLGLIGIRGKMERG